MMREKNNIVHFYPAPKRASKALSAILFFSILNLFGLAQTNQGEEILRHFDKNEKLVPHSFVKDTISWGYVFGHNFYYDYEWGEKYQIDGGALVIGVIAHIIGSNKSDKTAFFSVSNVHKDMKPAKSFYFKSFEYNDINIDGSETRIMFDSSVYVRDSFFVTFGINDYAHDPELLGEDTIYLLATEEGARDEEDLKVFGRNCIRTHGLVPELSWVDTYNEGWIPKNVYLAIFPIMDFTSSSQNGSLTQGNVQFFKSRYNQLNRSIQSELLSKADQQITVRLIGINGKEITKSNFNIKQNQKSTITLPVSYNIPNGNYIIIASGKNFKMAQKIAIK